MKKFTIQIIVLLIVAFVGLLSVFNPTSLGLTSVIPGGGVPVNSGTNQNTGTNSDNVMKKILFIDANSTGNPELVKSVLTAEVAGTPEKRGRGLSYRDSLDQNSGMIFLFDTSSKYTFIMPGMRFPLDFIWVQDDRIVYTLENIPPDPAQDPKDATQRYQTPIEVNKVIEVNAGYIKAHNIKVGDRIRIEDIR